MKKGIYAIYDKKGNNYSTYQWQDINDECAVRTISDVVNSFERNKFSENPSDYELYKLGEIDNETGVITPKVEFLKNLTELKQPIDKKRIELIEKIQELKNLISGVR